MTENASVDEWRNARFVTRPSIIPNSIIRDLDRGISDCLRDWHQTESNIPPPKPEMGRAVQLAWVVMAATDYSMRVGYTSDLPKQLRITAIPTNFITEAEGHTLMIYILTSYHAKGIPLHAIMRILSKTQRRRMTAPGGIVKYKEVMDFIIERPNKHPLDLEFVVYLFTLPNDRIGIDLCDPAIFKTMLTSLITDTPKWGLRNKGRLFDFIWWIFRHKIYTEPGGYLFPLLAHIPQLLRAMVWPNLHTTRDPLDQWENRMAIIEEMISHVPHPYKQGEFIKLKKHGPKSPYTQLFKSANRHTAQMTQTSGDGVEGDLYLYVLGTKLNFDNDDIGNNMQTAESVPALPTNAPAPVAECAYCSGHMITPPVAQKAPIKKRLVDYMINSYKTAQPEHHYMLPLPATLNNLRLGEAPRKADMRVIQSFYEGFDF